MADIELVFMGISGYEYPHTRVRCYRFSEELSERGIPSQVLSFRDQLAPFLTERDMFFLPDMMKIHLIIKAILYLKRVKPRLVVIQKIHFHSAAALIWARLNRRGFVLDLDDWDEHYHALFGSRLLNFLFFGATKYAQIAERIARHAQFCIASSHALHTRLSKWNQSTSLVPTGVSSIFFNTRIQQDSDEVICCWSGLVWGEVVLRSAEMMLRAFTNARAQCDSLKLKIIGAGDYWAKLISKVKAIDTYRSVECLSWLPPDEMPQFLASCHIGLLPLVFDEPNRQWVESKSPTKLFEYMACGLAVVASSVGEVRHVIEHGHSGLLARSEKEFSGAIITLTQNSHLRQQVGRAARERATNHYSLSSLGDKLANLF